MSLIPLGILAQSVAAYSDVVLGDNPVAFYLMNETSGSTLVDSSTSGNNGTYSNSPSLNVSTGLTGIPKAVTFNGTNQSGNVAVNSALGMAATGAWSVEFWAKLTDTSTIRSPFAIRDSAGSSILTLGYFNAPNAGYYYAQGGDQFVINDNNTWNGAWHQFIVTAAAAGAMKLYIDGTNVASSSASRGGSTVNRGITIGTNATSGQFFQGDIAAMSVYNYELTSTQVNNHRNAGI